MTMSYAVRPLGRGESRLMRGLARACPPLDVHTPYTYWAMADLFADSCLVLEAAGEPVGFLMSVRSGTTLFVWQIGIVPAHRGAGGSSLLYDALLTWARGAGVTGLTATIADDNEASRASLQSFCRRNGLVLRAGELVEIRDDADPAFLEVERRYAVAL